MVASRLLVLTAVRIRAFVVDDQQNGQKQDGTQGNMIETRYLMAGS